MGDILKCSDLFCDSIIGHVMSTLSSVLIIVFITSGQIARYLVIISR